MEGLIILSLDGNAAVALSSDAVKFAYPARRDQSECLGMAVKVSLHDQPPDPWHPRTILSLTGMLIEC